MLAQRGLQTGLGMSTGGGKGGARKITGLMDSLQRKGMDTKDLASRANSPIRFIQPQGGIADGYEATILPDLCAVLIEADQRGLLHPSQRKLAQQAARLQHGFATLGIIALVDKATGYEEYTRQQHITEILQRFVSKELRPWARLDPLVVYHAAVDLAKVRITLMLHFLDLPQTSRDALDRDSARQGAWRYTPPPQQTPGRGRRTTR